jgi:hypothetical protein
MRPPALNEPNRPLRKEFFSAYPSPSLFAIAACYRQGARKANITPEIIFHYCSYGHYIRSIQENAPRFTPLNRSRKNCANPGFFNGDFVRRCN